MNNTNRSDYRYIHDVDIAEFERTYRTTPYEIIISLNRFKNNIQNNNNKKNEIATVLQNHAHYIDSLDEFNKNNIRLYTAHCNNLQRFLRGIMNVNDLQYLCAIVLNCLSSNIYDIHAVARTVNEVLLSTATVEEKRKILLGLVDFVLDYFVIPLNNTIFNSVPIIKMTLFRGINGSIINKYINLNDDDFCLERGFVSASWQPKVASNFALNGDPSYVMTVKVPSNSKALSIYTNSAYDYEREILFPAGTLLIKNNGCFVILGVWNNYFNYQGSPVRGSNILYQRDSRIDQLNNKEENLHYKTLQDFGYLPNFGVGGRGTNALPPAPQRKTASTPPPLSQVDENRITIPLHIPRGLSYKIINGTKVFDIDYNLLRSEYTITDEINEKGGITTFFKRN